MNKEFCLPEISKSLFKCGFNEFSFGVYYDKDGNIRLVSENEKGNAVLYQQAIDFIRENFEMHIAPDERNRNCFVIGKMLIFGNSFYDARKNAVGKAVEIIEEKITIEKCQESLKK